MCDFLAGNMDTLYRVFIKGEPHKKAKADQGRWRLIICPPLCEQVVWAMVFGPGNDKEIVTVGQTPSMQGMSLPSGNWKDHYRLFRQSDLLVPMDKSAWDWTAHREFIRLDLELRSRLLQSEHQKVRWKHLASQLYERAFDHPTLVLSSGQLFRQVEPGVMKSGCVNTISTNSHMQVFLHILAALRLDSPVYPLPVAVGDDTLTSASNTLRPEDYAFTGAVVKDLGTEEMEFVGHEWHEEGPVPSYNAKHLVRYAITPEQNLPDFLDSMVRLYAHQPEFQRLWRDLAFSRDIALPSHEYVLFWYDYSEDAIYVG